MKRTLVLPIIMVVITAISFVCVPVPPCFSQADIQQRINTLRQNTKLIEPALVMKDFEQGKTTTLVIVNLVKPSQFRASGDFTTMAYRATVQAQVQAAQERVISRLDPSTVRVKRRFTYVFGFSADVTLEGLQQLTQLDDVLSINKSRILKPHLRQGIPLMKATSVRNTFNGFGVAIAICDTGIDYTHPDLGGAPIPNTKVIGGYDVGDGDPDPSDAQGHGTSCAGIAAGTPPSVPVGDYIGGVAPGAKLYAVKISTGAEGSATEDAMIAGWEWCITHKNDNIHYPILIISTSFGGPCADGAGNPVPCTSPCNSASPGMTAAAAACVAAGITLFVSSGNDGYCNGMSWPACISSVNSVGAVYDADVGPATGYCISEDSCNYYIEPTVCGWACDDANTAADRVTCYSNTATFLSLLAPSNNAYTTALVGGYNATFAGTSAACPYAAGAAACLQSWARTTRGSFLSPTEVRSRLMSTGDPVTDTKGGHISITRPRINLAAAVGFYPILHRDGAIYDTVASWITTAPPYYPGTDYARGLAERGTTGTYRILHKDGALYDSDTGWVLTAPPYHPGTDYARDLELKTVTIFAEAFDGSPFPPTGWTVVNNGGDCGWELNSTWTRANLTGGTGVCADADSDWCAVPHWPPVMDTELRTRVLDLSAIPSATLSFRASYEDNAFATLNDYVEVDISTDGGTSWVPTPLLMWDETHPSERVTLDISAYCGSAPGSNTVMIRFHYVARELAWWFEVDDVQITTDATTILHKDGALWNSVTGWTISTPPYYPGTAYAVDLEYRANGSYLILHKDGAVYDSATNWRMTTPPYYPGTAWAVDLELKAGDADYVILHRDGALWSTDKGWKTSSPPYYPGTAYAVDLEFPRDFTGAANPNDPPYVILHRDGAIYDSGIGWNVHTPPYYPGTNYAVDLEVK